MVQADKDEDARVAQLRPRRSTSTPPEKEKSIDVQRRAPGNFCLVCRKFCLFFVFIFLTDLLKTWKTDPFAGMHKEKQIGTSRCFCSRIHELTTPDALAPFPYCFGSFTALFTTQEYTQQSPGGAPLNESTDSVCTLCCKKHCALFLELPLCCLNVYMEQLGGLQTDVGSKNTASVQSLFSPDESNDTILKALQTRSSE